MGLMGPPFHEKAVADAAEQTHDEDARGDTNPAPIIVVRDVQALVEAVFDAAKTGPVEIEPPLCVQFLRPSAGEQGDVLVVATIGLAQQTSGLCGQRKTNLLSRDSLG